MLGVAFQMEVQAGGALDGVGYSVQTSVAHRSDLLALSVQAQGDVGGDAVDLGEVGLCYIQRGGLVEVGGFKDIQHLRSAELFVAVVGHALDLVAQRLPHFGGRL